MQNPFHSSATLLQKRKIRIKTTKAGLWPALMYYEYAITKRSDIYSKTASCEKVCGPKTPSQGGKRCEIKGGGQEMAVIIVQWQKF